MSSVADSPSELHTKIEVLRLIALAKIAVNKEKFKALNDLKEEDYSDSSDNEEGNSENYENNLIINMQNLNITDQSNIKEEWKIIDGCSKYMISNFGRIKNQHGRKNSSRARKDGYIRVGIMRDDGTEYKEYVHRLVALHFISNNDPVNKNQVDHINRVRNDNHVINLRWVNQTENNYNQTKHKQRKTKKVAQYDLEGNLIKIWNSTKEASETLKIANRSVGMACTGHRKTAVGFCFKYIEDPEYKDLEGEIWKNCEGYSNLRVSNYGRIETKDGTRSYGSLNSGGYYRTDYRREGIAKELYVHVLVCTAFNPVLNYDNLQVDHIDGNTKNNHADNLQFVTGKENCRRAHANGLVPKNIPNGRKISRYTLDMVLIKSYNSMSEIKRELGIKFHHISNVCKGITESYQGSIFRYDDI